MEPKHRNNWPGVYRIVGVIATVLVILVVVGGFYLALRGAPGAPVSTPTAKPIPPSSVVLSVAAAGLPSTSQSQVSVPSGTLVTLTVTPDHPLDSFQIYELGIYAHDPYAFSELKNCMLADTCSYSVSEVSGAHTYTGFLGDIGGLILANSNDITVTWSS